MSEETPKPLSRWMPICKHKSLTELRAELCIIYRQEAIKSLADGGGNTERFNRIDTALDLIEKLMACEV